MNVYHLLRLDEHPSQSPHGVKISEFWDSDTLVGYDEDGAPIIEDGVLIVEWGWSSGYAPRRMRLLRSWLRLRRLVRLPRNRYR